MQTLSWYQTVFAKTCFFSFIWAIGFALLIPPSLIEFWEYFMLLGSVPTTLVWDWFNLQNAWSVSILALINVMILLTPFWVWRKTQQTSAWLFTAFSMYGLINAGLGFTIIISMRGFGH